MSEESYSLKVIGHMRSPFLYKNGTPRQPIICRQVTGHIMIDKHVFNNPEHSLEGLEEFSHVWIFFIFHKNNNVHSKAKVKPPRLNGKKTGVFSTRSPYRPNNIGLTLAKIECVKGATIIVSGIDILDGTPVIDLKPYIPQYDNPSLHSEDIDGSQSEDDELSENQSSEKIENQCKDGDTVNQSNLQSIQSRNENEKGDNYEGAVASFVNTDKHDTEFELTCFGNHKDNKPVDFGPDTTPALGNADEEKQEPSAVIESNVVKDSKIESNLVNESKDVNETGKLEEQRKKELELDTDNETSGRECATADWITKSPVSQLKVRFTQTAEEQLKLFSTESSDSDFRFLFLKSYSQAKEAISDILHEDPRSTYRRNHCADSLYYFTLDVLHITCWFDEDLVEIVRIKPVAKVEKLKNRK